MRLSGSIVQYSHTSAQWCLVLSVTSTLRDGFFCTSCMSLLKAGYRNFFASVLAGNQRGFAKAIQESGIPRDELYICGSVLSNRAGSYEAAYAATKRGCAQNLGAFAAGQIGYLDQIMLDYPGPNDDAV